MSVKMRRQITKQTGLLVPADTWAIDCPMPRIREPRVRII